jgi:hypothetical protein
MLFKVSIASLLAFLSIHIVRAEGVQNINDPRKIAEALQSIPYLDKTMPYKSLADRLPNLGLTVSTMRVQRIGAQDAKESSGDFKSGDVIYDFYTNEPNEVVKKICPIWSQFQFIKRGIKWIPTSRTSQFLVTWRCEVPK